MATLGPCPSLSCLNFLSHMGWMGRRATGHQSCLQPVSLPGTQLFCLGKVQPGSFSILINYPVPETVLSVQPVKASTKSLQEGSAAGNRDPSVKEGVKKGGA